jgi:predicted MFS family arabinose efflux permease
VSLHRGSERADNYRVGTPDQLDERRTARTSPRARSRTVLRNRRFLRLWLAQIISNLGDWAYVLAVEIAFATSLQATDLVRATAIFLGVEGLTSAVIGLTIAGPIVDRFPRRAVMIVADLARCAAVATLVLVHEPAWVHVVAVAATLGAFRSVFHPAMMASVPELVDGDEIVTANGLLTSTFHLAIMVGPAVGAALVVAVGPAGAFALNAASFAVSAALLLGLRIPSEPVAHERFSPLADLREGAGYIVRSRLARGIALVMALVLLLLASQGAFQVAFVQQVLAPTSPAPTWAIILGSMTTALGVGMVVGSIVTPWLSRRFRGRTLLVGALVIVAASFFVVSRTTVVPVVLAVWLCNGLAGGCVNVTYETLLQVGTPARLRGRVFATVESGSDGAYVLGAAVVAWLGATAQPDTAFLVVGLSFLAVALIAFATVPHDASMTLRDEPAG